MAAKRWRPTQSQQGNIGTSDHSCTSRSGQRRVCGRSRRSPSNFGRREDGDKVDEEGATVVAAAQLEELIGPMDEEGEHFSAGDAAENGMVDSPTPPPSPPSATSSSSSSSLERATSALPRRGLVIKSAKLSKRAHKSQWPR